ncbi:MAG: hypothetical protein AAFQ17_01450 [Pseudomonadota bacterium]
MIKMPIAAIRLTVTFDQKRMCAPREDFVEAYCGGRRVGVADKFAVATCRCEA